MSRIPYVVEKNDKDGERVYDLATKLLKDRIIFINGEFNSDMADSVVAQLLFLESDDNEKDISLYINSPGGSISDLMAIYDVVNYIKPEITTIGYGTIASAASFLLAAGTPGKRMLLPSSSVMIHELSAGTKGKFNDIKNEYKHLEYIYNTMAQNYVTFTGQKIDRIKKDMERDCWMTAEEAVKYGLADKVLYKR